MWVPGGTLTSKQLLQKILSITDTSKMLSYSVFEVLHHLSPLREMAYGVAFWPESCYSMDGEAWLGRDHIRKRF